MQVCVCGTSKAKVQPARNTCFAQRFVAKTLNFSQERWRGWVASNSEHEINDGLGGKTWNRRAPDVLEISGRNTKCFAYASMLCAELAHPVWLVRGDAHGFIEVRHLSAS